MLRFVSRKGLNFFFISFRSFFLLDRIPFDSHSFLGMRKKIGNGWSWGNKLRKSPVTLVLRLFIWNRKKWSIKEKEVYRERSFSRISGIIMIGICTRICSSLWLSYCIFPPIPPLKRIWRVKPTICCVFMVRMRLILKSRCISLKRSYIWRYQQESILHDAINIVFPNIL